MRAARHPDAGTAIPPTRRELADRAVAVVQVSRDAKIGMAAATYAPVQQTCPSSCPLAKPDPVTGRPPCYAFRGRVGMHVRRLETSAVGLSPREVAEAEARGIDRLRPSSLPLRLHVSGDCRTSTAARIVARAAERYARRGGTVAWSYSHAWRTVPREAWGTVSVLASVESGADAAEAHAAGYAVALTTPDARELAGRPIPGAPELRGVACRHDVNGTPCSECRLCFDGAELRRRGLAILFELKVQGGRS